MSIIDYRAHKRESGGNMIILAAGVFCLMSILILVATSLTALIIQHNRLRASAEEIALAGAKSLNRGDRIGQMNNMIARSRCLIYASRESREQANENSPQLSGLAERLAESASESAMILESNRRQLLRVVLSDARNAVLGRLNRIRLEHELILPWLKVSSLKLEHRHLGKIAGIESGVEELGAISDLKEYDLSSGYLLGGSGIHLYKGGVNARLPGPDASRDFKLCSLPALVDKVVSPARISPSGAFVQVNPHGELPCAVRIELSVDVGTGMGLNASGQMRAVGTAVTTGSSAQK